MEKQIWDANQWIPWNLHKATEISLATGELQVRELLTADEVADRYSIFLDKEQIKQLRQYGKDIQGQGSL